MAGGNGARRALFAFLLFLGACGGTTRPALPSPRAASTPPAPSSSWPTAAWTTTAPEDVGIDSAGLADLLDAIAHQELRLHSLLVVRRGKLAFEAYAWPFHRDRAHDVASVTKSVTATLAAAAVADGALASLDTPLPRLFPDRPAAAGHPAVTLRHLLTMTSGLACDAGPGEPTLMALLRAADPVAHALGRRGVAPPGARWCYDSAGAHLAAAAVQRAVGEDLGDYARRRLFAPIGVRDFAWPRLDDVRRGWGDLRLRPRDMARFGLLALRRGRWEDRALVPTAALVAATTDRTASAAGAPAGGYGQLWWVEPNGAFFAAGRGGQYVYVAPALDLVVVTTASAARAQVPRFGAVLREHLLPAVRHGAARLPGDPRDRARLARAAARFRAAPAPRPRAPFPEAAREVSGRHVGLGPNPYGWAGVVLHFTADRAAVELSLEDGGSALFPVGLDGVPRVTKDERYATADRHAGGALALAGEWTDPQTFVLAFDTLDRIDRGTVTFHFPARDEVEVEVHEVTFADRPFPLEADFVALPPALPR